MGLEIFHEIVSVRCNGFAESLISFGNGATINRYWIRYPID